MHRIALGFGARKWVRRDRVLGGEKVNPPRGASNDGFNLLAGVVIGAHNHEVPTR